jgi:hypothetical protein
LPELLRKARKAAEEGGFRSKSGVLNHIEVRVDGYFKRARTPVFSLDRRGQAAA